MVVGGEGWWLSWKKLKKCVWKRSVNPWKKRENTKNGFHSQFLFSRWKKYRYSIWKLLFRSPFILFYFPELVTTFPVYLVCRRLWLVNPPLPPTTYTFYPTKGSAKALPRNPIDFILDYCSTSERKLRLRFLFGNPPFWNHFFLLHRWMDGGIGGSW